MQGLLFSSSTSFALEAGNLDPFPEDIKTKIISKFKLDSNHKNPTVQYIAYSFKDNPDNINIIAYSCDRLVRYDNGVPVFEEHPDCGSFLQVYNGEYQISIKYFRYMEIEYSKNTRQYSSTFGFSQQSSSYDPQLRLLSYTRQPAYIIHIDTKNVVNEFNLLTMSDFSSSYNPEKNKNEDNNFFSGIIKNLTNFIDTVLEFLTNFSVFILENIKKIFVPDEKDLQSAFDSLKSSFTSSFQSLDRFFHFHILDGVGSTDAVCRINKSGPFGSDNTAIPFDICKVPQELIYLARILLHFALSLWFINRVLHMIPILFGSYYVWERYTNKEGK